MLLKFLFFVEFRFRPGESDENLEEFFTDDEDDFDPEELKKECDAFLQPILAGLRFGRAPASPQPKS